MASLSSCGMAVVQADTALVGLVRQAQFRWIGSS